MAAPVIRQFLGTIPEKGQGQTTFDTNVDAFLNWQALQFAPDLVAFGEFASSTAAALVAGNLPPLTGRALDAVRVNAAANGVEFADVTAAGWALLDDANAAAQRVTLGAAALAGAAFTGAISSTAGDVNLKTVTALADAAATLTAAQLLTGLFTITPTVAQILTTATGTQIATALGGSVAGSHVEFTIVNLAAFDVTLVAGVGVTIVGKAVINDGSGTWRIRRDSASAVTIYTEAALNTKGDLNAAGGAPIYACRAWVNFNGTGTPAIRASGNVSSITDNGVGDYTVNFATAMQDADYAMVQGSANISGAISDRPVIAGFNIATAPTSSAARIYVRDSENIARDSTMVTLSFFR
jgi:hypothetical protein